MLFRSQPTKEQLQSRFPAIFAEAAKETTSDKYLYIPTYKLIAGLESQGFNVVGAKQANARTNNREHGKHVVYLSHQSLSSDVTVGQELPMLALTNSHNGLSSFAIDTAFFRLACSNGLLMPTTALSSARIIHKIGMQDDVINAAVNVVQSFPEQIKQIEAMKQIAMSREEQVLLSESAVSMAFDEEQVELNKKLGIDVATKMLTLRRNADKNADLWSTFNVIQENIIKGGLRLATENEAGQRKLVRTRAVNSIDRDAKLNKELMSLAQKFAALKGAA